MGEGGGGGEHFIFPPHPSPLPPGERGVIFYVIPNPNDRNDFFGVLNFGDWNLKLKQRFGWKYGGVRMNVGIGV